MDNTSKNLDIDVVEICKTTKTSLLDIEKSFKVKLTQKNKLLFPLDLLLNNLKTSDIFTDNLLFRLRHSYYIRNEQITNVYQLMTLERDTFLKYRNHGKKMYQLLKIILEKLDLDFLENMKANKACKIYKLMNQKPTNL